LPTSVPEEYPVKPLGWVGAAKKDLLAFPDEVVREVGHALYLAQLGGKHPSAKPLKGFGGASVLEIVEDFNGDTYRAVYTVRFAEVVYVLHAFQKKSKKGIATPRHEIEKVEARLKQAQKEYAAWQKTKR
jgi:phage-related protein